jgi:hypothetical protein
MSFHPKRLSDLERGVAQIMNHHRLLKHKTGQKKSKKGV